MSNPNLGGRAEPQHQCKATRRRDGERCTKFRLRGSEYCQFHGGRSRKSKKLIQTGHLPMWYKTVLNETLAQALEQATDAAPAEQLQIFEELALMRLAAKDAVALWSAAQESVNNETKAAAAEIMREALGAVVKTCDTAAKINAAATDKVSVHNIAHIVRQIVRIAHETMSDEKDALAFEAAVRDQIVIQTGPEGTTSTPDQTVEAMDDTVPAAPSSAS